MAHEGNHICPHDFSFYLRCEWLVRDRLYMPNLRYEPHHKICNLRYGTLVIEWESKGIETLNVNSVTSERTYFMQILHQLLSYENLWNSVIFQAVIPEFHLWFLPLVTWIDGFLDWIFSKCIFKILQSHNLNIMNVKWTNIVFVLRYGDETLHLWKPLLNTNDQRGSSQWLTQRNTIFVHFTFMFS